MRSRFFSGPGFKVVLNKIFFNAFYANYLPVGCKGCFTHFLWPKYEQVFAGYQRLVDGIINAVA
jgi:hypothetical protein